MTSETRCPSCDRSVSSDFRYCPYCQAELVHGSSDAPEVTPAPIQRWGRRDLSLIGLGLVALGLLGFVGGFLSVFSGARAGELFPAIVGGGLMLVLAGFVMVCVARGGGLGVASGVATGCASVAALIGVGALLVLAMIGYAFLSCVSDLNKLGQ